MGIAIRRVGGGGVNEAADRTVRLCLQLVADWLGEQAGRPADLAPVGAVPEADGVLAAGTLGDEALALVLGFIAPPTGDGAWYRAKEQLERRVAARLEGGYLVWVPQLVALPEREPHRSEVVLRVEETLARFVPGGHGEVRFPVPVSIRRSDAEGSYVTARGGLAPAWARFTGRVFGHFQLDSSELHRLPAGEGHLTQLIDAIVEKANTLPLGGTAEVMAEDAWPAQRLRGGTGVAFIGEPPESERSAGAGLRRWLRRAVQAARGPLREADAARRVLLFVGPYTSIAQEPVRTALLGFDPALFTGIDLIGLAAEGTVRALLTFRGPATRG
jgi:hypothetical protein